MVMAANDKQLLPSIRPTQNHGRCCSTARIHRVADDQPKIQIRIVLLNGVQNTDTVTASDDVDAIAKGNHCVIHPRLVHAAHVGPLVSHGVVTLDVLNLRDPAETTDGEETSLQRRHSKVASG